MMFESKEEEYFYYYLNELKDKNIIKSFTYNEDQFILSEPYVYQWVEKKKTKEKIRETALLQGHVYTVDFRVKWNPEYKNKIYKNINSRSRLDDVPFVAQNDESYIEIKPNWDFKNMTRLAIINIKWVYQKYGIYVQKIIPIGGASCLFAKTFIPKNILVTPKTKKQRKFKFDVILLDDYLKGLNNGN